MKKKLLTPTVLFILLSIFFNQGCSRYPLLTNSVGADSDYNYLIGPGDQLEIFVWDNPDISAKIPVRPDGKITVPLVQDIVASGKTPNLLAKELESKYATYIKNPMVVVIVTSFQGVDDQQIRIIGQIGGGSSTISSSGASSSQSGMGQLSSQMGAQSNTRYRAMSLPYEKGMTLLDIMTKIGSIGQYADGNRASVIRKIKGKARRFRVLLDSLVEDADMSANVKMAPGDILIIPQAYF
jgi:polysaccharide biosynthesis/export protein